MSDYQPRGHGGWPAQPPSNGEHGPGQPGGGFAAGTRDGYRRAAAGRPRRRRRRGLVILLAAVVVIAALLAVGDQVARSYAQDRIAQQIQKSANLSARPSVSIEGWPFLTQVAAHDLSAIDISASDITTAGGKLPVNVTAKATGVHVNSSFSSATVTRISGQATITYQALGKYLGNVTGIPGLSSVTFTPDPSSGPNAVTASIGVASVTATVVKTGPAQMTIKFGRLSGLGAALGNVVSVPDQIIDIPQLPAGLTVGTPTASSQGIVIPASASNTTLNG